MNLPAKPKTLTPKTFSPRKVAVLGFEDKFGGY
jgi:hypothetical protein